MIFECGPVWVSAFLVSYLRSNMLIINMLNGYFTLSNGADVEVFGGLRWAGNGCVQGVVAHGYEGVSDRGE